MQSYKFFPRLHRRNDHFEEKFYFLAKTFGRMQKKPYLCTAKMLCMESKKQHILFWSKSIFEIKMLSTKSIFEIKMLFV